MSALTLTYLWQTPTTARNAAAVIVIVRARLRRTDCGHSTLFGANSVTAAAAVRTRTHHRRRVRERGTDGSHGTGTVSHVPENIMYGRVL